MRQLLISALAALSAATFASYDLVMVADELNNAVYRYDGTSGIYLGSFGDGRLALPTGLSADVSTGLVYVSSFVTNSVQVYEYSTGVFRNEFNVASNARSLARVGSNLYLGCGTGIFEYSTSGTFIRSFGSGLYTDVHLGTDGFIYAYSFNNTRYERYTQTGTAAGTGTAAPDSLYPHWQGVGYQGMGYVTNYSTDAINSYTESSTMPAGTTISVSGTLDGPNAMSLGHGPLAYVSGYVPGDTTKCQIASVSLLNGHVSPAVFGAGQLKHVTGMTTVIAPEPASMTVLGLGLALIIRRKRK